MDNVKHLISQLVGLLLFVVPGVVIWAASIADANMCARRANHGLRSLWWAAPATWITDGPDPACPDPVSPRRGDRGVPDRPTGPAPGSAG